MPMRTKTRILIADDDADDRLLIEDAFAQSGLINERDYVNDGEEVFEYLRGEERWSHRDAWDIPGIMLLDVNMPKMDGHAVLRNLRNDPLLRRLPVVVLTTAREQEAILRAHDLGVNSFISKPDRFDDLVNAVTAIGRYWIELVELPSQYPN